MAQHPSTSGTLHTEAPNSHWGCCGQRRNSAGLRNAERKKKWGWRKNFFFLKSQVLSPVWILSKPLNSKEFSRARSSARWQLMNGFCENNRCWVSPGRFHTDLPELKKKGGGRDGAQTAFLRGSISRDRPPLFFRVWAGVVCLQEKVRKLFRSQGKRRQHPISPSLPFPQKDRRGQGLGCPPPKARYRGPYVSSKSCQLKR